MEAWKNVKRKGKIKISLKLTAVLVICLVLNWCAYNDTESYTRIMMHEMYRSDNIDVLITGSSSVFKGYDPQIISKALDMDVFNSGSANQQAEISYALIKECDDVKDLDIVVLDVSFPINQYDNVGDRQTYIITDYMRNDANKYNCLIGTQGAEGIANDIFRCIHRSGDPIDIVKRKLSKPYRDYDYDYVTFDEEEYEGNGFVYCKGTSGPETDFSIPEVVYDNKVISDTAEQSLRSITSFCKEHDIRLVLVETPLPDKTLGGRNYQAYVDWIREYSESNDLLYINYNLVKSSVIKFGYEDYVDANHLSGKGAKKYSRSFAWVLKTFMWADEEDKDSIFENLFYDTYSEKLAGNPDETLQFR